MTIRENDFRLNDVSEIPIRPIDIRRCDVSAKRRFDEMTFRENDVAPFDSIIISVIRDVIFLKVCEPGFPYCFLTDFTNFFL